MTWREAVMLTAVLLRDTSSWLQAVQNGWKHPVSLEWIVSTHIYDLLAQVNSKNKPKPYPTPWQNKNEKKISSKKPQSKSAVLAKLERMNPKDTDGTKSNS